MKKILFIIIALFGFLGLKAQTYVEGDYGIFRNTIAVNDSVVDTVYQGTLVDKDYVQTYVAQQVSLQTDSSWIEADINTLNTYYIAFDTVIDGYTNIKGGIYWDTTHNTISIMNGSGSTTEIGQEINVYVKNQSGSDINEGEPVYMIPHNADEIRVGLASNLSVTSYLTLGIATTDIPNGSDGRACYLGLTHNLNTSSFSEGDYIYLGDGVIQNTKPVTGHIIVLGFVLRSDATEGIIGVTPHFLSSTIGFSVLKTDGSDGTYIDSTSVTTDTSFANRFEINDTNYIHIDDGLALYSTQQVVSQVVEGSNYVLNSTYVNGSELGQQVYVYNGATNYSFDIKDNNLSYEHDGDTLFKITSEGMSINGGDVITSSDTIDLKSAVNAEVFDSVNANVGDFDTLYATLPHAAIYRNSDLLISATQNIWYKITGFTTKDADMITVDGDSLQLNIQGSYDINFTTSFTGNNGEIWEIGVFKNGTLEEPSQLRYTSTSDVGNMSCPVYVQSDGDDWFSFKIRNTTDNDDPTIRRFSVIVSTEHLE